MAKDPLLRLPELRRRLWPLAGQVRRLRRVEHASSRKAPSAARPAGPGRSARKGRVFALEPLAGETQDAPRLASGIAELDRVTGGGFVRGSVLLIGGDPGIGKSTLLIQAAAALARAGHRAVYISGEEAVAQVRLRAERLGLAERRSNSRPRPRSRTSSRRCQQGRRRGSIVIDFDPDHVDRHGRIRARHGHPGARLGAGADPLRQALRRRRSSWSAMSPRTARSPARAWSSTWSTRCSRSKAKARTSSASCAR